MRTFIIAPTVHLANFVADDEGIPPIERVFITDPHRLRGLNNPTVILAGWPEHWDPSDIADAERTLQFCDRGSMTMKRVTL